MLLKHRLLSFEVHMLDADSEVAAEETCDTGDHGAWSSLLEDKATELLGRSKASVIFEEKTIMNRNP